MDSPKKEKNAEESEDFSIQLTNWLKTPGDKTIGDLDEFFGDRSFALIFLVLMAIPALPLPTGGVSHVFEIITMLLSLELIAQRKTIWLPEKWRKKKLGKIIQGKTLPYLVKWIRRIEKLSRPRMARFLDSRIASTLFGVLVFAYALTALLAIPFSGLDTLPSMGILGISLGFILGDIIVVFAGVVIGALGMVLSIGFGAAVVELVKHLF